MDRVSDDHREDGAPGPRPRTRHQTDVHLVAATLAFRRRPLRIAAEDLAAPLRCILTRDSQVLGACSVIDLSAGGVGLRVPAGIRLTLGETLSEVRIEQANAIVAHGSAEVVNLMEGAAARAGLRFVGTAVQLRNLRLRDGAPVDPGGSSPEAAALPTDWRAAVAEFGQVLRWSGFFLDHATRPMGDSFTPAQEQAVFSEFFGQWAPRALGSLGRLDDLSDAFDADQRRAAHEHARTELLRHVYPGQPPTPPGHGAIDDHALPALFLSADFDASTIAARFIRYAWSRFPLIRTILLRPRWLGELWDDLRDRPATRALVIQPGPAAELSEVQFIGGRRAELTLLETDADHRQRREASWRERWPGPSTDLRIGTRPPTGIPASLTDEPPFDLIYGAGVLSGLQDRDARALVRSLFARLAPGGRMMLGNLCREPATSWVLDYVLGWPLRYRDPQDVLALAEAVLPGAAKIRAERDPTGRAVLLEVGR